VLASDQSLKVQVGAHDAEQISVNLKEITTGTLGLDTLDVTKPMAKAFSAVGFELAAASGSTPAVVGNAATQIKMTDSSDAAINGTVVTLGTDHYILRDNGDVFKATATPDAANNSITFKADATAVADKAVLTQTQPLGTIDAALQQVDSLRSDLGAVQNRFQSTITNLNNTVNNLSAARSRIEDADYAVEVSNMTRAQILQQAGTAVLAQANQVPQTVLSLLR